MRILLVNPNTSAETTAAMLAVARSAAPADVVIEGATGAFGSALITDPAALAVGAEAVRMLLMGRTGLDGVIIAAFGDPGLDSARRLVECPVTGIAEAGMAEAAAAGRRFAVATTTPALAASITRLAEGYGHAALFRGVFLTLGDPHDVMADPARLESALAEAGREAVRAGAEAVLIGGGPLAIAARALAAKLPIPIVEPVPAAIRLAMRRARPGR